jgi:phosphatidylglycerophosphate synthase
VRKRGPQPYWTPVAPLHRVFSYPLSYVYCALRLTPLTVTLFGLLLALAGLALLALEPLGTPLSWTGLALLNLGVIHDACDGEVARYRIHHGLQSTATSRVGIFADFWAFAILVQALLPFTVTFVAWRAGYPWWLPALGAAAAFTLLASYVAGFAQRAYWPRPGGGLHEESLSLAAGSRGLLWLAQRTYFYAFETAMFTAHATVALAVWSVQGGTPAWFLAYAAFVAAAILGAFVVATARTLRTFDAHP